MHINVMMDVIKVINANFYSHFSDMLRRMGNRRRSWSVRCVNLRPAIQRILFVINRFMREQKYTAVHIASIPVTMR